ncbi:MAG: hypothetical protein AMJ46_07835 [Latescibacteria bacterium DG_63]|jgi:heterodisulfide reductase subunit C|uniref:4Fe-4S ferredoxin-type domain-containing protein n=2 Tax=Bacteria division TA06 TaxID=1156500 RepID=A0A0S8JC63_UNCT6|nr:MAG: hypothetical protein AMJ46_07835 [Latescibacteria bacterium DG_63]KPK70828.1 MAG: hypothetical protein AMJ82_02270 [candidate division TA06 bacterium SM23_40]KPL07350.1 MAG: hypothetical protein AMJ71_09180 [candidate division TA06 bacterium SM1_40]
MEIQLSRDVIESPFVNEVLGEAKSLVNNCYQCRKCAAGCPVAYEMDYTPAEIMHAVRLGQKDLVLGSKTIWICAACKTCSTRCPQDVEIVKIMDAARRVALREGIKPKVPEAAAFYRSALFTVKNFGRLYEIGLIGRLKLATRDFFKDIGLGLTMFRKGKLSLLPSGWRRGFRVRTILNRIKNEEGAI